MAGDDSALYNALLLTLRDAAKVPGRKVVIVFSNGPDNASMVAPDDVRAVAEDEGIPIYVISTNEVNKDRDLERRFQAHLDADRRQGLLRQDLAEAGGSIRRYPRGSRQLLHASPTIRSRIRTKGFRKISVEIPSDAGKKYRVRARPGYRPRGGF